MYSQTIIPVFYDYFGIKQTYFNFCHTCRRFFSEGGGKKTPSRLTSGVPFLPAVFQPSFSIFPTFWDKKTQPSFLAVFGSRGGGSKTPQRPLDVFFAKIGTKVPKIVSDSFTPYSAWFHKVWR